MIGARRALGAIRTVAAAAEWLMVQENYATGRSFRIGCHASMQALIAAASAALPDELADRIEIVVLNPPRGRLRGNHFEMVIVDDFELVRNQTADGEALALDLWGSEVKPG